MRIRWCLSIILAALALALTVSAGAELMGCRTHAGELDDSGVLHLYGCSEHGESFPDGLSGVRQALVSDHRTILLRDDGTVGLFGLHDFPAEEVESWTDVAELAADDRLILARRNDGTCLAAFSASWLAETAEFGPDSFTKWVEAVCRRSDVARLLELRRYDWTSAVILADGTVLTETNLEDAGTLRIPDAAQYGKMACVNLGGRQDYLLALRQDGELHCFTDGQDARLCTDAADFAVGYEEMCVLTKSGELLFSSLKDPSHGLRSALYPADNRPSLANWTGVREIGAMVAGDLVIARCDDGLYWDGYLGETNPLNEVGDDLIDFYEHAQLNQDGNRLVIRHDDGAYSVLLLDGSTFFLSSFNRTEDSGESGRFEALNGPRQQIRLRDLQMRVSFPYAIREDGTVLGLDDCCLPEALSWTNVKGIAAEVKEGVHLVAALTADGRVLTAAGGADDAVEKRLALVSGWTDMVQVAIYHQCIAGVTASGEVRFAGEASNAPALETWQDVVSVTMTGGIYNGRWCDETHLIGLRRNGTVIGDLWGVDGVVSLSGCNRVLAATHADGTATVWGWNFLQDCVTRSLRGVGLMNYSDEFYTMPCLIGPDRKVYLGTYNYLKEPMEGLRVVQDAVCVYPLNDGEEWMALRSDGTLWSSDGRQWDLQ